MDWRLHQAQGIFSLMENEKTVLDLTFGLMPYKYNPEARNLGEFLFRSGTYPFFLVNDFNFPLARLSGLRLKFAYRGERFGLRIDQFILTERTMPPMSDFSLAAIIGANLYKMFDVGFGVDFARVITLNDKITTPSNAVFERSPGDTGHYSFRGTKLMARATIDPFYALRGSESFIGNLTGENGGKLYGEIAVVGLKNYPKSNIIFDVTQDRINPGGTLKFPSACRGWSVSLFPSGRYSISSRLNWKNIRPLILMIIIRLL